MTLPFYPTSRPNSMKLASSGFLVRLTATTIVLLGMSLPILTRSALAQTAPVEPIDSSLSGDGSSSDPFSNRGSGQTGSLLNILHRVTLSNGQSLSEFNQQQQGNINSAASDFRTRQLELLRQQGEIPANPTGSIEAPTTETPAEGTN